MEPAGVNTELFLRAYEALILWFAWMLAIVVGLMALLYVLLLWEEYFSSPRRPVMHARKRASSGTSRRPAVARQWPSFLRIVYNFLPIGAARAASLHTEHGHARAKLP